MFYARSHNPLHNEDLLEIKDRKFLDQLKQEFESNIDIYKNKQSPLISGTVVTKAAGTK